MQLWMAHSYWNMTWVAGLDFLKGKLVGLKHRSIEESCKPEASLDSWLHSYLDAFPACPVLLCPTPAQFHFRSWGFAMCHELVYPSETSESYLTTTSIITTTGIKITHRWTPNTWWVSALHNVCNKSLYLWDKNYSHGRGWKLRLMDIVCPRDSLPDLPASRMPPVMPDLGVL